MAMELETVSVAPPARSFLGVRSGTFASLATSNGSRGSALLPHSTNSTVHANLNLYGDAVRGELLTYWSRDAVEFEFSLESHLIILFPEGVRGRSHWSNGKQTGKLSPGVANTIIFNPAQEYLRIKRGASRPCRMFLLTIDPAVVNRLDVANANIAELQFRQQIGVEDQGVRLALAAIKQEIEAPELNSDSYIDILLMLLLTRLMRCASNFATPSRPAYVKGGLSSWRLKRALELLEADPAKTPSLADLAGSLRLHPGFVCRAFKQSTGLSPGRYSLAHRINCAKEMMKDRNRALIAIALDCGFCSASHFSVAFKRITGVAPRIYRKSL